MKKKILILLVLVLFVGMSWMYWIWGGFIEVEGRLIGGASVNSYLGDNKPPGKIYSISLSPNLRVDNLIACLEYDELNFPNVREYDLICVARKRDTGMYVVLRMEDNNITEIFTSKNKISFPTFQNNNEEVIYIEGINNNAYLYKYDIKRKSSQRIYDKPVDCNSRPQVLTDDSILFVAIEKYTKYLENFFLDVGQIKVLNKNGDIKDVSQGRYPVWFEDGKRIFYYDMNKRNLILYDIKSGQKTEIKKIRIESQMVVSPDKKYIAFDEGVNVEGMIRRQIVVVTVDGLCALTMKPKGYYGIFGGLDGLNWVR